MSAGRYKRVVLGLPHSSTDYRGVHAIAEFAELFRLDLLATYLEDTALRRLGALPCVREYQPLGGGWQPVEGPLFTQTLEKAADSARRLFDAAVQSRHIAADFRVAQGSPADLVGSLAQADDIIGVIEPRHPAEQISRQFTNFVDAALHAASAVMLMPGHGGWRRGPIAAIVSKPDDPSVVAASTVATVMRERLVLLSTAGRPLTVPQDSSAMWSTSQADRARPMPREPADVQSLAAALARLQARLLVVTRGSINGATLQRIISLRQLPMLVVEPDAELAPGTESAL